MTSAPSTPGSVLLVEEGGTGGVADYTCELARALAAIGWRVHLATAIDQRALVPTAVRLHRVFPYVRGRTAAGRLARALRISPLLNGIGHLLATLRLLPLARHCDVVHMQGEEWPPLGVLEVAVLRVSGKRVVYTPHNTFSRNSHGWARSRRTIMRLSSRVIVHSNYDLSNLGSDEAAKARVIPHGIYGALASHGAPDVSEADARGELGAGENDLVVLLFGQMRPDKGIRDLLIAMRDTSGVRVVLAGEDCGALEDAKDLMADLKVQGRVVVRRGFATPAETGRLFLACDVVALPYQRASASGVLMLAYGYERPVVVYPVGGLPEYVTDGRTGWVCERPDPAALAETIARISAGGREACRARGKEAMSTAHRAFGWKTIARSTAELYREAI